MTWLVPAFAASLAGMAGPAPAQEAGDTASVMTQFRDTCATLLADPRGALLRGTVAGTGDGTETPDGAMLYWSEEVALPSGDIANVQVNRLRLPAGETVTCTLNLFQPAADLTPESLAAALELLAREEIGADPAVLGGPTSSTEGREATFVAIVGTGFPPSHAFSLLFTDPVVALMWTRNAPIE